MQSKELKKIVQEKYGQIAEQGGQPGEDSCCGQDSCCGGSSVDYTVFSEDYSSLEGYNGDADLNLGCGIPTQYAGLEPGQSVLDLGSGAGNDCFVARSIVGGKGKVTGLDFTDEMLQKATTNLAKTGYTNIDFVKGDIEEMPLPTNSYDVVISNCVLNLVPDKQKAFSEISRVLQQGGHFCISDVVTKGVLPEKLKEAAELYAGCVSGAIDLNEYLGIIKESGYTDIEIKKQKEIKIPDETMLEFLSRDELNALKEKGVGIFSVTINASKI